MRFYDWLLRLYPKRVRARFGHDMRLAFREDHARARARGASHAVWFIVATVIQTGAAATGERLPRVAPLRSFLSTDVRDAVRSLFATPLVTSVAVVSLALGIGANTALFTILYSLVLKPLPVADPERLALLAPSGWTNPIWEQIRDRDLDVIESAFAWSRERFNLATSGPADPVNGAYVSGGMFGALGVTTAIGRPLTPADDVRGGGPHGHVAVVSHQFWQQRLGAAADVVGRPLTVHGVPFTIVGVTAPHFVGPEVGYRMDVYLPLASEAAIRGPESALDGRSSWWLEVMVRLRPGSTMEEAAAALNVARPAIRQATIPFDTNADRLARYMADAFTLEPAATGVSSLRDRFARPLTIIMLVVAAVLVIACANIANVMLARASARRHEITVRLALGASRTRLGCQLLVESLLLAVAGGVAGLALARVGAALLVAQLDGGRGAVSLDLSPDWRVLGFTALAGFAATLLFGVAPATSLASVNPNEVLKEHSRTVTDDRRFGLRSVMVIAQVALSFALVAAAALFLRTFGSLVAFPIGFTADNLLIVTADARHSQLPPAEQVPFYQRVADAASSAHGVERASLSFMTPMSGRGWNTRIQLAGSPSAPRRDDIAWLNAVAPGWFQTYGMRLIAGRDFTASDVETGERVVVVSESFVRRFAGSGNPIGLRLKGDSPTLTREMVIVGVVNDAVYRTVRQGVVPTMYVPMTQGGPYGSSFSVTARLRGERHAAEGSIAEAIRRVDPKLAIAFRDYCDLVRGTMIQERLVALLASFFGALAMLLAALGLYGITSYSVSRRRTELAVRMALGATTHGVLRLVLRRIVVLLALGTAIGLGLILWAGKFIEGLLFRVESTDATMLTAAATVLFAVGLIAGWVPAYRVSRLDPTLSLRQ